MTADRRRSSIAPDAKSSRVTPASMSDPDASRAGGDALTPASVMFSLSTFVIGPAISGDGDGSGPDPQPTIDHHGH